METTHDGPRGAATRPKEGLRVLVDTEVWVDYLTDRDATAGRIAHLFEQIEGQGGTLLTSVSSLQDVFALVESFVASELAQGGGQTSEASRCEVAWGCVRLVRARSVVVGVGLGDCFEAEAFRLPSGSFADALMLAAALRGGADVVLSERDDLRAVAHVPVRSVAELSGLLGAGQDERAVEVWR